jgi:hypothetical protein
VFQNTEKPKKQLKCINQPHIPNIHKMTIYVSETSDIEKKAMVQIQETHEIATNTDKETVEMHRTGHIHSLQTHHSYINQAHCEESEGSNARKH